jgi:hypothetical protein
MEHQLWMAIVALLLPLDKTPCPTHHDYQDHEIARIFFWAVVHDRPIAWACSRKNWPIHLRRRPLPSTSTMSRRLRSPSVVALLDELSRRVTAPTQPGVFWMIDGKPLVIGGASGDSEGPCGRAANGMARGYKLHAILNSQGEIAACKVAPMNVDERVVAERLIAQAAIQGYLVADANYDSNPLHAICDALGNLQLLTPRRFAKTAKGTGHRRQAVGRLRCLDLWSQPEPRYIDELLNDRRAIERNFGNLTNWGGGLGPLPAWVRTLRRVDRWVRAKLVLTAIKRRNRITT